MTLCGPLESRSKIVLLLPEGGSGALSVNLKDVNENEKPVVHSGVLVVLFYVIVTLDRAAWSTASSICDESIGMFVSSDNSEIMNYDNETMINCKPQS